jgi:hypothetical protein
MATSKMRKPGRPFVIHASAMMVVRMPPVLRAAIDKMAKRDGTSVAETARKLIEAGLTARGVKLGKS